MRHKTKKLSPYFIILLIFVSVIGNFAVILANTAETNNDSVIKLLNNPEATTGNAIQNNIEIFWETVKNVGKSREEVMEIVSLRESVLRPKDPEMFEDILAMALKADVSYSDLLAFNLYSSVMYEDTTLDHGCTSWIAHGTATANGNTLIHKNRDISRTTQQVTYVPAQGLNHGYIKVASSGDSGAAMGINDQGLALVNDYVDVVLGEKNVFGTGPLTTNRYLLESCASVDDVFDWFAAEYAGGYHALDGTVLFVADEEKAAIIEYSANQYSSYPESVIINGVGYRSNYFVTHPEYNRLDPSTTQVIRYSAAQDYMEENNGLHTALGFNELSRHHKMISEGVPSEHDGVDGSISNYHTLSATTMEIDANYPGDLSVMWTAIGTPCTAIYTPIHIGSTAVNTHYTSSEAWILSESILEKQNSNDFPFGSLIPHYLEVEENIMAEEGSKRNEALSLLNSGQSSAASSLLTAFDDAKADVIFEEMTKIDTDKFWQDSFHYLNGIGTSTNVEWSETTEDFVLDSTYSTGFTVTYDVSDSNFVVYENDVDVFPFRGVTGYRNDHQLATSTDRNNIASSNNVRWETDDPGSSDEMLLWIDAIINEDIEDISQIDFVFEGYSYETADPEQATFYMYLLEDGKDWLQDGSWDEIGSPLRITRGTDKTMTCSIDSNFEKYIGLDGSITWMVGTTGGHSDQIYCDYLKIDVISTGGIVEYEPQGELRSINIDLGGDWDQFEFSARHELPTGSDIAYKILNTGGTELASITASQAEAGYDISSISTGIIRLFAQLTTTDDSVTPILKDWTIKTQGEAPDLFPVAEFTASDTSILVGESVDFTFSGSQGDAPATYLWNFGDSGTSSSQNPTYQYNTAGIYTVSLTVTDADSDIDTEEKTSYIVVSEEPVNENPVITHPSDKSYTVGNTGNSISWTITDSDVSSTSYTITRNSANVGTGTWASGSVVSISVDGLSAGTYTYIITALDGLGGEVSDTVVVTVNSSGGGGGLPLADIIPFMMVFFIGLAFIQNKKVKKNSEIYD
ncbi:MAG: PKD domain-containing protein [archaeon]|nr:PKD domain-containing protein [archaeon]